MAAGGWEYRGRWALVTGASAGIGEAFARALAGHGTHLVLAARRVERLRELGEALAREHGVQCVAVQADLARPGAAAALWAEASAGRRVHLLVNNAGFGLRGPFHEQPVERLAEMVQLNCTAPLELMHAAVRAMRADGGGVVNVASIASFQPVPTLAAYSASKAFLATLSEAVAEEDRATGVRVVTLNPGPVRTEFQGVAGTQVNERTLGVLPADEVVAQALARLEAGGGTVTPGLFNRASGAVVRVAPRSLVVRAAKVVMRKLR